MPDKIIRCKVELVGGPRNGETMHVPLDTDRLLTVMGRPKTDFCGVFYDMAPILCYTFHDDDPNPDTTVKVFFSSIRRQKGDSNANL